MSRASARRPQLTLTELHQLKWLLGAGLTLLAVGTVFYMEVDAWVLMGLTAAATVATAARPGLPARVPRLVHWLAFPAMVAFFAGDLWLKTEILPAMVRLAVMLLLYRNITYRQRRDDLQVVVLGLFLVVVAGVLTVSLTFAAHLLVYTGCALALLLVITLTDAATGGKKQPPVPVGETPDWAQEADWGRLAGRLREVSDWRVLGFGAVLFAGVVGVSALLFLAIPRFQLENSMFLDRLITKKARSGFSDTIKFGDVTEIQQDTGVALSVDVSDQSQIPASPYWRMLVLDHYENGTFRLSLGLVGQEFGPGRTHALVHGDVKPQLGVATVWTFFLESGVSRYLPLLGRFELLRFREVQNFRLAPNLGLLALREEPASMTAYRVEGFDLSGVLPDPGFAQRWRERAEANPRRGTLQVRLPLDAAEQAQLAQLGREIAGPVRLAAGDFAQRTEEWLRRNHAYTLSPSIPAGAGDPLVRWLVSREAGHCELFAGAFVLLARASGYPARVVTGFRGGSWNGYSNNFTIRNADAHAWAEIFDEATGAWLRADPLGTSAAAQAAEPRGEQALVSRMDRSWKARLDSLRVFWYRRIVSFDTASQAETLKAMKEATQSTGKRLREEFAAAVAKVKAWLAQPWDGRRLLRIAAAAAALAALVWGWREFGRGWLRGWSRNRGAKGHPVRREAGGWLRRLEAADPDDPRVRAAIAELQRLRYGAPGTWPEPEGAFRRARVAARIGRPREDAVMTAGK